MEGTYLAEQTCFGETSIMAFTILRGNRNEVERGHSQSIQWRSGSAGKTFFICDPEIVKEQSKGSF